MVDIVTTFLFLDVALWVEPLFDSRKNVAREIQFVFSGLV